MTTPTQGGGRSRLRIAIGVPLLWILGVLWTLAYTGQFLTGCVFGGLTDVLGGSIEALGNWINNPPRHDKTRGDSPAGFRIEP